MHITTFLLTFCFNKTSKKKNGVRRKQNCESIFLVYYLNAEK